MLTFHDKNITKIGPGVIIRNTYFFYFAQLTNNPMNYEDVLDFLFSALPMYHRIGGPAYKSNLDTTIRMDDYFGNPHHSFISIHIAGTNGKGSVSHMLASVLQSAGYKTGLYTSPHLVDFRERIRVNGKMIDKDFITAFVNDNKSLIREMNPSFFEMTVALAFLFFRHEKVDVAVIETGMGGRLDSTNIIRPEVSVITNIGYDHMQFLGDTLEKIAGEKAGIIKEKVPVVIGESAEMTDKVFSDKAAEMNAGIYFADKRYAAQKINEPGNGQLYNILKNNKTFIDALYTDLTGDFQAMNIVTVFQVIEILKDKMNITTESLTKGLGSVKSVTGLMGRWEVIRRGPLVICDTGHNYDGLKHTIAQLLRINSKTLHIIIGFVSDKDISGILSLFPARARYYFTRADIPRAMDQEMLMKKAADYSLKGDSYGTVYQAYLSALGYASEEDLIFIGGSTFIVADLLLSISDDKQKGEDSVRV